MHFEASLTVKVPREKAYAAYTDFEAMPMWSKGVTAVRILKRERDTVYLEGEGVSPGRTRIAARKVRLLPPDRVESEGKTRFARSKRVVKFEEVPAGTKVTVTWDVQVTGLWSVILTPRESDTSESSTAEELASFARYVEGLPWEGPESA